MSRAKISSAAAGGCFKGYIAKQDNNSYRAIGIAYYADDELALIAESFRVKPFA
ncbi:hypothetical protein ACFQZI_14815 [Mucilaginibacter lutimaris]|uniref:Uncharacterized protein n=1 Tax=Mucilaginibacter lutimaris TaxID=931629 RepID=A0ABW2ZIS5_9SPHI